MIIDKNRNNPISELYAQKPLSMAWINFYMVICFIYVVIETTELFRPEAKSKWFILAIAAVLFWGMIKGCILLFSGGVAGKITAGQTAPLRPAWQTSKRVWTIGKQWKLNYEAMGN